MGGDRETVIWSRDGHFAGAQILYRLVGAAMAELQLKRRSAEREAENLMAETDPEDRPFTHQIMHGFVGIWQGRRIARTIGEKNPIWIQRQRFVGACGCRDNSNFKAFLAQEPKDVFLDAVVVRRDSKSDGRKLRFAAFVLGLAD